MPFKIVISLESEFSSQELADFFSALAQAEQGNMGKLIKVFEHPQAPDASTLPLPTQFETDSLSGQDQGTQTEVVVEPQTTPTATATTTIVPVPEPNYSTDICTRLSKANIDTQTLNKIIHRHDWARGKKSHFERKWGFTKASQFARIGAHFNDWSLMDGSISTKEELQEWCRQRGFQGEL